MNHNNTSYEIILADTEESKKIHFKVRYQVYCLEKGYEDATNFQDGMEKDEYDAHAIHFLIRHKVSKQWVGAFRLVMGGLLKLPMYQHAKIYSHQVTKPQHRLAEFSRLSIIRQFQNLPGRLKKDHHDPDLVYKAICTGIEYSRKHGVNIIIFLSRRSLAKIIKKMGIKTGQIGVRTAFRGTRYPYKIDLTNFPQNAFDSPKSLQNFYKNNVLFTYSHNAFLANASIAELTARYFNVIRADTPDLMEKAYRLRHQAYGLEATFNMPNRLPNSMEMDEYDGRSHYSLIQHKGTGAYAATTRLIVPDNENPQKPFPLERYCRIDRPDIVKSIPRTQLAEVSRFCVSEEFKRRPGESETVSGVSEMSVTTALQSDDCRRTFPHITVALIVCLLRINTHYGITHWLAVMEPALIVLLRQMGISLIPIGPPTHYHGHCIPCIIEVKTLVENIRENTRRYGAKG